MLNIDAARQLYQELRAHLEDPQVDPHLPLAPLFDTLQSHLKTASGRIDYTLLDPVGEDRTPPMAYEVKLLATRLFNRQLRALAEEMRQAPDDATLRTDYADLRQTAQRYALNTREAQMNTFIKKEHFAQGDLYFNGEKNPLTSLLQNPGFSRN